MTNDTPQNPPLSPPTAPPEARVKLADLDRSTVMAWMQRAYSNASGQWAEIPSPEDRKSKQYRVIALLQDGAWVSVSWGSGGARLGTGSGGGAKPGAGRPPGRKNSKPRSDKGKSKYSSEDIP